MRLRVKTRFKFAPSFRRNPIPDDARAKVARRQGGLVRKIMRRMIRTRKKNSAPGQPPTNREGQLKKFIFYFWDPFARSVVIGPEKLPGAGGDTPAVLEGTKTRSGPAPKPRPYAAPALTAAKQAIPELWKDSIK